MIHVIATIEVHPGTRTAFLAEFKANVPAVLAEDGCHEYVPTLDVTSGLGLQGPLRTEIVTIVEKWRDLPALHAHLKAPHMLAYREKVKDYVRSVQLQVLEPA